MNPSSWPRLLVVDVEGNGANPPNLVEVAALPVRDGLPDKSMAGAWLTKPPRPVTPLAARVHSLTNQVLDGKPGWEEIADEVHAFLGTAWIAAHNAHVDYRVLSAHLPKWQPSGAIDTLRLAKATYPGLPKYSLGALIEHVRPDLTQAPAQRHRATYDAFATAQLLLAMPPYTRPGTSSLPPHRPAYLAPRTRTGAHPVVT
ncbi:exonuclease domain-containing protein [Streptomyces sp. NPDC058583]|uniref:3'-5' exonuclease n=1 Tax=unclassified Streptomyces TaxID=2593676 RepID=UPI00365B323B